MASTILATPHFVRLNIPERGFGDGLDAIIQFFFERGEELRTGWSTRADQGDPKICFCFRDLKNAEDFAERFSGEIWVTPPRDQSADFDL